ncbi:Serine/threonine protein phosphatase 7 long form isogeny [Arachis hypogaea]|nr:Serine/threonine protein phosphatase 7 long form isogeny [Arachis hypogaea]
MFHLPVGEVTVTLEDVIHILGLQVKGEPVTGRSDSSYQFLVDNYVACFGRQPDPDDHVLGKVNLHWVRRCRDSEPCDTQESIERYVRAHIFCVLGTVAWERMPFMAPIPRNQLLDIGVPLARRWSHWRRHTRYTRRSTTQFRRGLDDMGVNDFIWRPYIEVDVPVDLGLNLFMCSMKSPLVSFECIEWHPTDRVRRQFGLYAHYRRLSGAQHHDWRDRTKEWLDMWRSGRYDTLQVGKEIVDFHPLPLYYDWYTQQYGGHLRLSDRVVGEEADTNAQQEGPPQPAGPQHQELAYDQGFQFQAPAYEPQFQAPAYPQFMMPGYEQHYQVPAYEQHVQEPQQHQAAEPYIPQLLIPADGQLSPFVGLDSISFSRLMRDTSQLFPAREQQGPVGSEPSVGRRATSGHASDFSMDRSPGHVGPTRLSAPPRTALFDLNECPQSEEGFLGDALQHESHSGGYSAQGMSRSNAYDTGGASMPDVGVGDSSSTQGRSYNLRTHIAPPDKYTPSQYAKKAPRK